MKPARIGATVLLIVLAGWWLLRWLDSPERQIKRNLEQIAKIVSKTPGENNLTALAKARELTELFADNFEFEAEQFDFRTRDRQQLAAGVHRYRSASQAIAVKLRNIEVNVERGHRRATSYVTTEFLTEIRDIAGREAYRFQVNWIQGEDDWRIDYVRLLEVIEAPERPFF